MHNIHKKIIALTFSFLTIWSCNEEVTTLNKSDETSNNQIQEKVIPFLIDTFDCKITTQIKAEFGVANYFPLYFGIIKDSLILDHKIRPYLPPSPPPLVGGATIIPQDKHKGYPKTDLNGYEKYFPIYGLIDFTFLDSANLQIDIDTTQVIKNIDFETLQDSTFAFRAYPVLLKNNSDSILVVGSGTHLDLIMEAKNEQNEWKPIERRFTYFCGTGLPSIILPPGESVITSAKIYQGNFETEIRLRMRNHFSPTFKGKININQFRK